jgi:hypothetical protein
MKCVHRHSHSAQFSRLSLAKEPVGMLTHARTHTHLYKQVHYHKATNPSRHIFPIAYRFQKKRIIFLWLVLFLPGTTLYTLVCNVLCIVDIWAPPWWLFSSRQTGLQMFPVCGDWRDRCFWLDWGGPTLHWMVPRRNPAPLGHRDIIVPGKEHPSAINQSNYHQYLMFDILSQCFSRITNWFCRNRVDLAGYVGGRQSTSSACHNYTLVLISVVGLQTGSYSMVVSIDIWL